MKTIIKCTDAVCRLFRNRDGNIPISTKLTVLLTVVLCGGWFSPIPAPAAEIVIPFAEEIFTVQDDRVEPSKPPDSEVSIPYTRLDVMVRDGIAFMRLLQVYHNHGDTNQGYAFSLPLQPDTAITGFTIWDRGIRYPGAIEDRPRAEKAYQEVTGDETPTMKQDPGLVRQSRDRFEMRVFPIFPGEDKQIELVWHRRLSMEDGEFVLTLPLADLSRLRDPRHGNVSSRLIDVSVYLEEDLPIAEVRMSGEFLKEQRLDKHRRFFRGLVKEEPADDLQVVYSLKLDGSTLEKFTGLEKVIGSNPDVRFFLVVRKGDLPPGWDRGNVYPYSLSEGWKRAPDVSGAGQRHLLLGAEINEFFGWFLGDGDLKPFLEALPDLDPDLPSLRSRGGVLIDDVATFPMDDPAIQEKKDSGEWTCCWLSGTFDRTGQLYGLEGGNTAVVPEPETWALFIGGGILSAYFLWWRRRKIWDIRSNSTGKA